MQPYRINAALFVDFDNIYISLATRDKSAAEQFAEDPGQWLEWLTKSLPSLQADTDKPSRRVLIRRCYLNPESFAKYRPYFIRSAFEVIDCPPLTSRGKTSTDIHLVMDVLDTLRGDYINEFILLSGDADFTPLLLRLRQNNRFSAVVAIGYVSPAYKAASDYVVSEETFIDDALGLAESDALKQSDPPHMPVAARATKPSSRPPKPGSVATEKSKELSQAAAGLFLQQYPQIAPLARKVSTLTEMPFLTPDQYALLLQELAREIDLHGYSRTRTSKALRDTCNEKGAAISRSAINFILTGIQYSGYDFGALDKESPKALGAALVENTVKLCKRAQLVLTDEEIRTVSAWLIGKLPA